jgi:agmatine deiminase
MSNPNTPAQLGFRMPAEWEPHEATWIAWPHNREDWPGKFEPVPWVYTEIVRHLSKVETVSIVVKGDRMERQAKRSLESANVDLTRVRFFKAKTDRVWIRDFGPTFILRDGANPGDKDELPGPIHMIDWKFTGWAKYKNHRNDNRIPRQIAPNLGFTLWVPRVAQNGKLRHVVMEGGAIDVNGRGSLMTSEECLLSDVQARNPGLDRAGLERIFAEYLGIRHVIWLARGITGDDTHGHVDDLARFVDPRTVVTVVEPRLNDPNHEPLEENLKRLQSAVDQDGQPLRVITLPMPSPVLFDGQRLPASYANFYIANGLVLVPTFNDPADRVALNTLSEVFPDRQVVGIHCLDLVLGLGTLHCLSQQQPRTRGLGD